MLLTDHKPLTNAFYSVQAARSDRQQRHLSLLTEYISSISYIKGNDNIVADCLSRPANAVLIDACDLSEIVELQSKDEEMTLFADRLKIYNLNDSLKISCEVSTPYPRPYVPLSARRSIFESLHSLNHPGIKSTLKLIKSRYFWPDMGRSIRQWCTECMSCQQSKVHKHVHSPILKFELPSERFQTVHIDIVGLLPAVKNLNDDYTLSVNRYLLTMINRTTR